MPSRTPGKYSLDAAMLMVPSSATGTSRRGAKSNSSFFDTLSRFSDVSLDGGCAYSTPRASVDRHSLLEAKPSVTALTGNSVSLGKIGKIPETMEAEFAPSTEVSTEKRPPARVSGRRDSVMQALIEAALDRAEKKTAAMASTNRPFSWLIQGLKMLVALLVLLVRLIGSILTGVLVAVAILGAVWILQPDNFLVVSVSREVKQLLRTYDLPGADFAWG